MADETIIYNVVIETGDLTRQAAELRKTIDELKGRQKDLDTSTQEGRVQFEANAAAIRDLQSAYRQTTKDIDNVNKQIQAETGSIAANRAELARLTAEYIKIAKPTAEQTSRIKTLSDQLKAQEKAIGDTRRNVGNYADSLKEALANSQTFGGAVNGLSSAVSLFAGGPLIIAIAAIGKLADIFGSFNDVLDPVERALGGINAVFSELISRVGQFGGGLAQILSGNISGGIDAIKNSFTGLSSSISAAFKEGQRFVEFQQRLDDVQRTLTIRNAEAAKQVDVLLAQAKDRSKSEQERIDLLQRAGKIEKDNFNTRLQVAKTEELLSQQQLRRAQDRGQTTDELENKAAEATVNRLNLERESLALQERIQGRINQLIESEQAARDAAAKKRQEDIAKNKAEKEKQLKDDADFYAKLSENIRKAEEERQKQAEADAKKITETRNKEYEDSLTNLENYYAEQELIAKNAFLNGEISEQEYNEKINSLQTDSLDSQLVLQKDYGESTVKLENQIADEKIDAAKEEEEEKKKIRDAELQAAFGLAEELTGLAQSIALNSEKNAELQKGIAVFQIAVDTAAAISSATRASTQGADVIASGGLSIPIKIATLSATILANIARATAILNSAPRQFYDGGYTGDGDPHERSNAIGPKPYIYHKREYVIPHQTLENPFVSDFVSKVIEPMRRGNPSMGLVGFADGGFVQTGIRNEISSSLQSSNLAKAISQMRPVVRVSEINDVQTRVSVIDRQATL
jgi:hypothetical protein